MQMDRAQIWAVKQYRDFTGGENRRIFPELLAENEVVLARNCIITSEGALESRKGKTPINTTALPAAVRAAWRWSTADGSRYITCVAADKVYHAAWDGSAEITFGAAIKTLTSSTSRIRGKVWKDVLILSDAVDNPFRVSGAGVCTDLGGTPPKFNIFTVHASKLVAIDAANPSQVRFSGLEDYDVWNALDVYNVLSNDGTQITGLDSQQSGLAIYKENSTWGLFGFDRYDFQLTTGPVAPVGAINQDTVLPGMFVGKDNFYLSQLPEVSPMKDTHGLSLIGKSATDRAAALGCYDVDSRLAVVSVGNDIFCLNGVAGGKVITWDNLDPTALTYAQDTGEVIVGCADGVLYRLSNAIDDNGTPFYTDIRTAYWDMGSVRQKVFRNVHHRFDILSGGYDMLVNAVTDFGANTSLNLTTFPTMNPLDWGDDDWGVADWASATDTRSDYVHWLHGMRGNYLSIGFKTASRIKFLGYTVKFREAGYLI